MHYLISVAIHDKTENFNNHHNDNDNVIRIFCKCNESVVGILTIIIINEI